jgi:hypothetical protein
VNRQGVGRVQLAQFKLLPGGVGRQPVREPADRRIRVVEGGEGLAAEGGNKRLLAQGNRI